MIIRDIILLNRIDPTTALVPAEDVDVGILVNDGRRRAATLIQVCNPLPSIHIYRIPFAALEDTINGPSTNGVDEVALVGQCVRIPALVQRGLLSADLVLGVIHKHGACHVREARVESTRDQNITVR